MNLFGPLVRHVTAPLYARRDGYVCARHRRELDASQWWPASQITELQNFRLKELLEFAYKQNPFHRRRMQECGIGPSDIRTAADLAAIPVLSKDDIRAAGASLFSAGYSAENTLHTRTGGSTGVPLHVYVDREAMNWKHAATWRHNGWAGWRHGDKVAAIWGDTDKGFNWKAWLRFHLYDRMIYLDTLKFSTDRLWQFHKRITSYRPTVMIGHAHSLYQFARFCAENQLRLPRLSGVVTTAMTLSELERRCIEEAFRAPVFNRYGCEEISIIASESDAHCGLHVFSEGLILEYLKTEVEGEYELLVTDLLNRAMPMIRYAIGDVVRPIHGKCESGRGLERLGRVSGRTADFLYRQDGTPVFGISILDTYIIHIAGIRQAQIVQEQLSKLVVNIVPDSTFDTATVARVREVLRQQFGDDMEVDIVEMPMLPQTDRGKYRFSVCKIAPPGAQPGPN